MGEEMGVLNVIRLCIFQEIGPCCTGDKWRTCLVSGPSKILRYLENERSYRPRSALQISYFLQKYKKMINVRAIDLSF